MADPLPNEGGQRPTSLTRSSIDSLAEQVANRQLAQQVATQLAAIEVRVEMLCSRVEKHIPEDLSDLCAYMREQRLAREILIARAKLGGKIGGAVATLLGLLWQLLLS